MYWLGNYIIMITFISSDSSGEAILRKTYPIPPPRTIDATNFRNAAMKI